MIPKHYIDKNGNKAYELHKLHPANKFRLMLGQPLLEENNTTQENNMITKHQEMVKALAKSPELILASLDPAKCNLLHATNGLADEFFELQLAVSKQDKENILEELGDMLFYTEALIIGYEDIIKQTVGFNPYSQNETMQLLFQVVKRHIFYDQELNLQVLINVYFNLKDWISWYASQIGKTMKDVEKHNMDKLAKRYKNYQYSDQAAKERKDKNNASA